MLLIVRRKKKTASVSDVKFNHHDSTTSSHHSGWKSTEMVSICIIVYVERGKLLVVCIIWKFLSKVKIQVRRLKWDLQTLCHCNCSRRMSIWVVLLGKLAVLICCVCLLLRKCASSHTQQWSREEHHDHVAYIEQWCLRAIVVCIAMTGKVSSVTLFIFLLLTNWILFGLWLNVLLLQRRVMMFVEGRSLIGQVPYGVGSALLGACWAAAVDLGF